jgi:hypothetical protein
MQNDRELQELNSMFPAGSRVELVRMNDRYAPPAGTQGTVVGIDSVGSILIDWDNGSGLNIIPEAGDMIRRLEK